VYRRRRVVSTLLLAQRAAVANTHSPDKACGEGSRHAPSRSHIVLEVHTMLPPSHSASEEIHAEMFVVYDRRTGAILHLHEEVTLPGASPRTVDVLSARIIELAAEITGRQALDLAAIQVDENILEPQRGFQIKVDLERLCLVQEPVSKQPRR
jgi:hypothetical protein